MSQALTYALTNPLQSIANRIRAARLRRQLRKLDEWLGQLHDQVTSGQQAIEYWTERRRRMQAQLDLIDTPQSITQRQA